MTNFNNPGHQFLIALCLLTIFSCKNDVYDRVQAERQIHEDSIRNTIEGKLSAIPSNTLETITIEDCEYLVFKEEIDNNSAMGFMAHKGNCQNPIHKPDLDGSKDSVTLSENPTLEN